MKTNYEPSINEAIEVVKVYMTLLFFSKYSERDSIYKEFIDLYRKEYMEKACIVLGSCKALSGLVLYSEKYQLYLSLTRSTLPCYNHYVIK
jgi:hypothetical protein